MGAGKRLIPPHPNAGALALNFELWTLNLELNSPIGVEGIKLEPLSCSL